MRPRHLALSTLLLLAATLAGAPSLADDDKAAQADSLFREALSLMKEGRHAEACPKLAKSQRLDPGAGTQFRLAECYENVGRLATAWRLYNETIEAAKKANRKDREAQSRTRADALNRRVPRLEIFIAEETSALPAFTLRIGEDVIPREEWERPVPVDPGIHVITAKAPGKQPWQHEVNIGEATTLTITVPALVDAQAAVTEAPKPVPVVTKAGPKRAWVIAGAAAAGATLALGLGLMAGSFAKAGERDDALLKLEYGGACFRSRRNCPAGVIDPDSARATLANGAFYTMIAAGLFGAGTLTYALWPRKTVAEPQAIVITPALGGVVVSGQW